MDTAATADVAGGQAIDNVDRAWRAIRHDGRGRLLIAATAGELNALIRAEQERLVAR